MHAIRMALLAALIWLIGKCVEVFLETWFVVEWHAMAASIGRRLVRLARLITPKADRSELDAHFQELLADPSGRGVAYIWCGLSLLAGAFVMRLMWMRRRTTRGLVLCLAVSGTAILVIYREPDVTQKWKWLRVCARINRRLGGRPRRRR